jgi:hypothetical protein
VFVYALFSVFYNNGAIRARARHLLDLASREKVSRNVGDWTKRPTGFQRDSRISRW